VASPQQSRDTRLRQGGESAEADISAMQATALVSLSSDVVCGSYLRSTTARFSLCESKPQGLPNSVATGLVYSAGWDVGVLFTALRCWMLLYAA
jgi:hypothetical protein